ncbi:MAG: formate dehydrogenase subunit gamma [Pseudomonadales bacterium]
MEAKQLPHSEHIEQVIDQLKDKPGALLPILHGIQDHCGYIPVEAISKIGAALNQTSAEIHGVISFYRHFHLVKDGTHRVEICRAEACQARGSRALESHAKETLGVDYHQTTSDRNITLEPVYCLGNCATGPNVRIGDDIIGRISPDKFDRLVTQLSTATLELK